MKYCPRCGVELEEQVDRCVLCGQLAVRTRPATADAAGLAYPKTPAGDVSGVAHGSDVEIGADAFARVVRDSLSEAERRRVAVELLAVSFGSALLVTVPIDLFTHGAFTWSKFSSLGVVSTWLFLSIPLILAGAPWLQYAVLAPYLILAAFLLAVFRNDLGSFLRYGFPVTMAVDALAASTLAIVAAFRRKGLNAVAVFLCGLAVLSLFVEGAIDLNASGALSLDWSVIVAIALVPVAGLLFHLHYRVVDQASLRKLFRL